MATSELRGSSSGSTVEAASEELCFRFDTARRLRDLSLPSRRPVERGSKHTHLRPLFIVSGRLRLLPRHYVAGFQFSETD